MVAWGRFLLLLDRKGLAYITDLEHDEFGTVGRAQIFTHHRSARRLLEDIARPEFDRRVSFHLDCDRAFQNVEEHVTGVKMLRSYEAGGNTDMHNVYLFTSHPGQRRREQGRYFLLWNLLLVLSAQALAGGHAGCDCPRQDSSKNERSS